MGSYETTSNQCDDSRNILSGFVTGGRVERDTYGHHLMIGVTKMTEMRFTLKIRMELRKRSRIEACPSELLGETRLKDIA